MVQSAVSSNAQGSPHESLSQVSSRSNKCFILAGPGTLVKPVICTVAYLVYELRDNFPSISAACVDVEECRLGSDDNLPVGDALGRRLHHK